MTAHATTSQNREKLSHNQWKAGKYCYPVPNQHHIKRPVPKPRTTSSQHSRESVVVLVTSPSVQTAVGATLDVLAGRELSRRALAPRLYVRRDADQGRTVGVDEERLAGRHEAVRAAARLADLLETLVDGHHEQTDTKHVLKLNGRTAHG